MGKKVMIVDDSRTVRQQVAVALLQAGFEVVEAENGVQGLERIQSTPDLSMVICDVNMPHMNGIDMLNAVKALGKTPTLPIIMLTTEGKAEAIEKAKAAGAKGWIVKPFKAEQLVAVAKKLTGAH